MSPCPYRTVAIPYDTVRFVVPNTKRLTMPILVRYGHGTVRYGTVRYGDKFGPPTVITVTVCIFKKLQYTARNGDTGGLKSVEMLYFGICVFIFHNSELLMNSQSNYVHDDPYALLRLQISISTDRISSPYNRNKIM